MDDFLLIVGLNVPCSFIIIIMIICGMLVMTGHVGEIGHVLICCAYIRGYLEVSIV